MRKKMTMKEVYRFLEERTEGRWNHSTTFEWQEDKKEDACFVNYFPSYVSVDCENGHEIFYTEIEFEPFIESKYYDKEAQ